MVSCHRNIKQPASIINMGDVSKADQLLSGFYEVNEGKWRWTARLFSVALGPPTGLSGRGARVVVHLYIPDAEMAQIGPLVLTATSPGYEFDPMIFSKAGSLEYVADVPSQALCTNVLPVTFAFDRSLPPSASDERELGAVVSSIGLQAK